MHTAIAVFRSNGRPIPVLNLYGRADRVRLAILDRVANDIALEGEEFMVRLPKRLGVNRCHCVGGKYIKERRVGKYRNLNVL